MGEGLTDEEREYLAKWRDRARNAAGLDPASGCKHRFRPMLNVFQHPDCLACGAWLEAEWSCALAPDHRCLYPGGRRGSDLVRLTDAEAASITCVHCDEAWLRTG